MTHTIVLIHEIYGVTENLLKLSDLLRAGGYRVVLPSLYADNYRGTDERLSYRKFFTEVKIENAVVAIGELIEQHKNSPLTLIGFSVGATIAYLHGANKSVGSVIGFYGSRIRDYVNRETTVPCDLFFCEGENFDVHDLVFRLNTKEKTNASFIGGSHGFYSKESFDSPLILQANSLILGLLKSAADTNTGSTK